MGRKQVMKWKKRNAPVEGGEREHRDDRKDIDIHGGSYPLEEVKAMPEYGELVEQSAAKRTFALNIGYCGTKYQGLQTNEGAITIEGLLERALFLSGGIKECNFGNLQKVGWTRAARTDKGVHAIGQCVSMRLTVDNEVSFIPLVNRFLPEDIRLFAMTKTTKSFNARLHCSHRRYEYLLPTYLLMNQEDHQKALAEVMDSGSGASDGNGEGPLSESQLRAARSLLVSHRIDEGALERFRANLKKLEGTHSFHNFTSSKTVQVSNDSQVKRFMMDISCEDAFLSTCEDGTQVEWVKVSLLGQSFLLNQIRKMLGLVVDVTRGAVADTMFDYSFSSKNKVTVAMMPGVGLFLYELFFDRYHTKLDAEDERLGVSKKRKADKINDGLEEGTDVGNATANNSSSTASVTVEEVWKKDRGASAGAGGSGLAKLTWSADPALASAMSAFRTSTILPQIMAQEDTHLEFMHHLEYLRTAKSLYRMVSSEA